MKVEHLDYHRNGICGLGFHVGIVATHNEGKDRRMLVIRFPKSADKDTGQIVCAAFDLALLAEENIRFFENSWRGDHFYEVMDQAIAKEEAKSR